MTEKPIRPSEDPLWVFISSRQDPEDSEMSHARELTINEVAKYPGMNVWAFEDAPASSETARVRYIRNAGRADIVIWLIGPTTTDPIVEEVSVCMRNQGRLLAFKLPAAERDDQTEALINEVSGYATWKTVDNIEELPAHINAALTDEMLRRYRDPAPVNHDLYLMQKHRESIADTKRLWTSLGVPDDIATELADDHSVGHKLTLPTRGTLAVNARQGSGKSLAAQRLYQQALHNRLKDHSQPLPVFLNARSISGDLKDHIEGYTREQGSVYGQRILVIIDSLDETGRQKANQLLIQAESYTDANQNVAAVAITRPLPGLNLRSEPYVLPECSEEEFLSIASRVAGREVNQFEVPFREYRSRLPLFAVMVGAYLRRPVSVRGRTPSQIVNEMVRQALGDSVDGLADAAEFLKTLAVASINSGESVEKSRVAIRTPEQTLVANSRLVVEEGGKLDFTLAIFREWFAARAIVERSVSIDEILLDSDRWVVPLAIAINSENPSIGQEIMENLASRDPGMAGLVLKEVKHNWANEEPPELFLTGTALNAGTDVRNALEDWKEGLGPLMLALGMLDQMGNIPTLGVSASPGRLATSLYRGNQTLDPVVLLPENLFHARNEHRGSWPSWIDREIEPTRVWQWSITHEDLSDLLSKELNSLRLALESQDGFHEFAYEFASYLHWGYSRAKHIKTSDELMEFVESHLSRLGDDPRRSVTFSHSEYTFTVPELELFRERVYRLSSNGIDILQNPWPEPDKEWPPGQSGGWWWEIYTEERLLHRTNAIFNGALRIYNEIVERCLPSFNKRNQMRYTTPVRIVGELRMQTRQERPEWNDASLLFWTEPNRGNAESGVFFEMGPKSRLVGSDTRERVQAAGDELLKQGLPHYSGWGVLPGNEERPATKLAHEWLHHDLRNIHWV